MNGEQQINQYLENMIESVINNELKNAYLLSLKKTKEQIADLHEKYSVSGKLTYDEMTKYNRLNQLYDTIARNLQSLFNKSTSEIIQLEKDVYQESYFRHGYVIEQNTRMDLNYGLLNEKIIEAAIAYPVSGLKTIDTMKNNLDQIYIKIKRDITQGLIQGLSYRDMAETMQGYFQNGYNDAVRVARTEGGRVTGAGTVASYDQAESQGIKIKKQWVATLDSRTRDAHGELDGEYADDEGYFYARGNDGAMYKAQHKGDFGVPELDCNCRCTIVAEIEEAKQATERMTDEGLQPYQTWAEWAGDKGWTKENGWPAKK